MGVDSVPLTLTAPAAPNALGADIVWRMKRTRAQTRQSRQARHDDSVKSVKTEVEPKPEMQRALRNKQKQPRSAVKTKVMEDKTTETTQKTEASVDTPNQEAEAPENTVAAQAVVKAEAPVEVTEYERKRLENIQRNLEFMRQMGISTAKIAARTAIAGSPPKPVKRKPKEPVVAVRKSRRLEGLAAEPRMLRDEWHAFSQQEMERSRLQQVMGHPGRLAANMDAKALNMDEGLGTEWLHTFATDAVGDDDSDRESEKDLKVDATDVDVVKYQLAEDDVIKATQERVYSLAFHPRSDRVLVAAGDKRGNLALWSADAKKTDAKKTVAMYRPHTMPTTQLIFSPTDTSKLISSSFDGTIREFDLKVGKFSQWYATDEDEGISSLALSAQPDVWLASGENGNIFVVDRREAPYHVKSYEVHEKKVQTVSQHPMLDHCIATASLDRTVCLWDLRSLKKSSNRPFATMPHYRSVNCAYFSPNGKHLVTVGQENYVFVFPTESVTDYSDPKNVVPSVRIPHNNMTGRWLTKLHAAWDPKRPDQYILGCMQQPRRVQIFDATRKNPIQELTSEYFNSVHSINVFHPKLDLIAGGNSSGRLCIWRAISTSKSKTRSGRR